MVNSATSLRIAPPLVSAAALTAVKQATFLENAQMKRSLRLATSVVPRSTFPVSAQIHTFASATTAVRQAMCYVTAKRSASPVPASHADLLITFLATAPRGNRSHPQLHKLETVSCTIRDGDGSYVTSVKKSY